MTSPAHMAQALLAPITSLFGGGHQPDINIPSPPPPILPASQPTTPKPRQTGMQQSFLSGVAGAGLPGSSDAAAPGGTGSAGRTGATLLGS